MRDAVFGVMNRVPGVSSFVRRGGLGVPSRYPPGDMIWRDRGSQLAGALCPRPSVAHGGATLPLDQLLGDGFTLVMTCGAGRDSKASDALVTEVRLAAEVPALGKGPRALLIRPDFYVAADGPAFRATSMLEILSTRLNA